MLKVTNHFLIFLRSISDDCDKDGTACSNGVCLEGLCHCNDGFGGCNCQVPGKHNYPLNSTRRRTITAARNFNAVIREHWFSPSRLSHVNDQPSPSSSSPGREMSAHSIFVATTQMHSSHETWLAEKKAFCIRTATFPQQRRYIINPCPKHSYLF